VCPQECLQDNRHGLEIVSILQEMGTDEVAQIAGFLLGVQQLAPEQLEQIEATLGVEVVSLYDNTSRIQHLSDLLRVGTAAHSRGEADEDDVRVVQICLAKQLSLLRFCKSETVEFQKKEAERTRDVYAPLANRLGIWQLKWELEDLSFRYLNPNTYKTLARALEEKRRDREQYIQQLVAEIKNNLEVAGIEADVQGRPKHIFSIWKKMQRKDLEFRQLWDIRGVRILVSDVEECYAVLSRIHSMWEHIPEEFSDYIAMPKSNGYQSIHTVVLGPGDKTVEIQIRTRDMHEESELGVAAHWRYKEKVAQNSGIDTKVIWLRQLLEWKTEVMGAGITNDNNPGVHRSSKDTLEQESRIYVFTPKGTIIDLPIGSTPIDFAYSIHSEVGHRTRGARVNGKMVPLSYRLKTGEQVHIQTVKSGGPSRDWLRNDLGNVQTSRARNRISQWFKHADYDQNVSEGRNLLERELRRLGMDDLSYDKINQHTHFKKIEDMLAAIGSRDFKLSKALYPFKPAHNDEQDLLAFKTRQTPVQRNQQGFTVHGVGNLLTHLAKCCEPIPGDEIIGYISSGRGVSIHRTNCKNIINMDQNVADRLIDVDWGQQSSTTYNMALVITAYHRSGLLHDVTEALKSSRADVLKVNMDTDDEHVTRLQLQLEIPGVLRPEQLITRLSAIQNVFDVRKERPL
jgi:GTP pyrophosphokinase